MTIGAIPPAEVAIDPSLVRALLLEQHTDLVHLALVDAGKGWDNRQRADALEHRLELAITCVFATWRQI